MIVGSKFPKQSPLRLVVLLPRPVLPNSLARVHHSAFAAQVVPRGALSILCHSFRSHRAAKRRLVRDFRCSRAFAQHPNSGFIGPRSTVPIGGSGRIMKLAQHSFSFGFGSLSVCFQGSQFGGSWLQSQSPSGLTPRSSGPGCAGPLNFFR